MRSVIKNDVSCDYELVWLSRYIQGDSVLKYLNKNIMSTHFNFGNMTNKAMYALENMYIYFLFKHVLRHFYGSPQVIEIWELGIFVGIIFLVHMEANVKIFMIKNQNFEIKSKFWDEVEGKMSIFHKLKKWKFGDEKFIFWGEV